MGTIWHNGLIYTLELENKTVQAVFTENGKIVDTGSPKYLRDTYHSGITKEVDLDGNTMIPGLVDSHMHLVGHGERLMRLDLSAMKSREEVLSAVEKKCKETPKGEWVVAEGWNENEWVSPESILLDELDAISQDHPLILKRICRHAMVVNSRTLLESGLTSRIEEPAGGVIGRYENGRLNGLFKEEPAMDLITANLPGITQAYVEAALRTAIKDLHSLGLTGCHTEDLNYYNGFQSTYDAFVSVIENEGIRFRANLLVHHEVVGDMQKRGYSYGRGTPFIAFDGMKIFADGSLGGSTALLSEPYADNPRTQGVAIFTEEELYDLVKKARSYHMPVAVHAIGDLAFEYVLNAIEKFPPEKGLRDRLIHAQIMRKDLLERSRFLPVIFDIQPGFVPSDFPWVEGKVGKELLEFSFAWKTYLEMGIPCAGGSDAPIEWANPLLGIHAAVTRRKPNDPNRIIYGEKQCLTMHEAVSLYTSGSALAIGCENERGKIKKSFDADFTVLDKDIFTEDTDALLTANAVMTVIGDQIVYKKGC
ncbi:amidohydrolase [Bacillus sp. CECT 9360]|uniref:amidohydrolase n=1 Tax=Bacillus sp. CECT 9360 TaxID=2845821 RepID=UPI001E5C2353|nr:amidohydrolase [Bacillus sp. CECT 9360]CAH0346865.1 N-substituted formamide deformylase [Bacillus sp. CECT 9360]